MNEHPVLRHRNRSNPALSFMIYFIFLIFNSYLGFLIAFYRQPPLSPGGPKKAPPPQRPDSLLPHISLLVPSLLSTSPGAMHPP